MNEALRSMLAQDYPEFEVIAVNDRSTDDTLARMRSVKDPRLKVIDITELPSGWLGKNHALYEGAKAASGEWLLFTDGDVVFDPRTLSSAVRHVQKNRLDHLALMTKLIYPDLIVSVFASCFAFAFFRRYRPWAVSDPKSKAHMGVGAFNFLARKAYDALGTHKAFAMNVLDDMELGRRVKLAGFRQGVAFGGEVISVRWIEKGSDVFGSLEKNAFAGFNYSLALLVFITATAILTDVLPFILPFVTHGAALKLSLGTLALILLTYGVCCKWDRKFILNFPFHAAGMVLIFAVCWRSAILALSRGGIRWRDTFYPLEDLKST